ncbi:MAG: hypothetical protein P9M03_02425 [Candidatus Theseobacter exili]|nr:hypothetical protein [Candidatus Theseobacter exili]
MTTNKNDEFHTSKLDCELNSIEYAYALPDALGYDITERFRKYLGSRFININSTEDLPYFGNDEDPILKKKRNILLCLKHSPYLEPCPGTKNYLCCGYKIMSIVEGCHMDCSYCILQGYLNAPMTRVHVNIKDYENALNNAFMSNPDKSYRIGTGELADSLFLDELTGVSERMIHLFSNYNNSIFEIKTKDHRIEHLLNLDHNRRTIISWSLNTPRIINLEERRTSSLKKRLEAAAAAEQAGYKLGFHFDPLIDYSGWEKDYEEVVKRISKQVNPENICWISLGCLRFPPLLWPYIRNRFPSSKLYLGEFIRGLDGKTRYFKTIRTHMYSAMKKWIQEYLGKNVFVYLCMESELEWQNAFDINACTMEKISSCLDNRI